jgi:hypothetical protein
VQAWVRRESEAVADNARALVRRDSGALADSIRVEQRGFLWRITADARDPRGHSYALVEETGSRPHTISPRTASRLVLYARKGPGYPGYRVMPRGASVRHPGTKGSHFLTLALRQVIGRNL